MIAATFRIGSRSSTRNVRTRHAVVTGTILSLLPVLFEPKFSVYSDSALTLTVQLKYSYCLKFRVRKNIQGKKPSNTTNFNLLFSKRFNTKSYGVR
jgi:hypothetical protein